MVRFVYTITLRAIFLLGRLKGRYHIKMDTIQV